MDIERPIKKKNTYATRRSTQNALKSFDMTPLSLILEKEIAHIPPAGLPAVVPPMTPLQLEMLVSMNNYHRNRKAVTARHYQLHPTFQPVTPPLNAQSTLQTQVSSSVDIMIAHEAYRQNPPQMPRSPRSPEPYIQNLTQMPAPPQKRPSRETLPNLFVSRTKLDFAEMIPDFPGQFSSPTAR